MAKDCIAAVVPVLAAYCPISNFLAGSKIVYKPLLWASPDWGFEFSSLPMHALAEEIPDNGIFELNSLLALGRSCLQVVFNWKYFNNSKEKILGKKI